MLIRLSIVLFFAAMAAYSQVPPIEPGVSHDLAIWRAAHYSDVRYKLNLTLEKMSPVLKGTIEIRVNVSEPPASAGGQNVGAKSWPIILDWRRIAGHEPDSTINNVSINGTKLTYNGNAAQMELTPTGLPLYCTEESEHLIIRDGVVAGENVIKLDFTSPILTSGSAITRYVDKEDGAEYIYSLFVPSDASTAFPVFDQPDLKARFSLEVLAPNEWKIISNSFSKPYRVKAVQLGSRKPVLDPQHSVGKILQGISWQAFSETKPISTYVFAFAAGPFTEFADENKEAIDGGFKPSLYNEKSGSAACPDNTICDPAISAADIERLPFLNDVVVKTSDRTSPRQIYVRKSQAAKFKPHAAEVFRLTREGIKFLETYFDYKFPFPKYDLVLIPEFPFGGMEHAGATFLRESSIIFPTEPTKSDYISRANLIFHETAHQWFGDTVTMKWFDDLWLKEGFAEFMAYKTLEKVMPEANAWKVFYERNKQAAYATDSTRGTTPIYQPIANLSAAKSAYGNIVYRKAPSFLRQAEFYLGEEKFQTAVRAFLKKHEFANAGWEDLVKEFEAANGKNLKEWADAWVTKPGMTLVKVSPDLIAQKWSANWRFSWIINESDLGSGMAIPTFFWPSNTYGGNTNWHQDINVLRVFDNGFREDATANLGIGYFSQEDIKRFKESTSEASKTDQKPPPFRVPTPTPKPEIIRKAVLIFPNYQDYGYGIFLLDDKSRDYVLKNIQNEKDPFLRSMMWGSLWDSVREGELDPKEYVELVVKNLSAIPENHPVGETPPPLLRNEGSPSGTAAGQGGETDEAIIQSILGRVATAMNYYVSEPPASAGGQKRSPANWPPANAGGSDLRTRLEAVLIDRMQHAPTLGQRITFYRAFLNIASSENARRVLKGFLTAETPSRGDKKSEPGAVATGSKPQTTIPLRTKDKFDIVTRLIILGDSEAPKLLADLEKKETGDDAKRYAYAAKAGLPYSDIKAKYWNDFVSNKDVSESWIEAAVGPFNSLRHSDATLPYLERALAELPNLKRNRKIFFVNGWLAAFIGGQKSQQALDIVNKFLADNPSLDKDLRLKILENVDLIERAVKIRSKYS